MSVAIAASAESFAKAFVPIEVRNESLQYIRISAFSSLFGAVDVAVSAATRALDRYVCLTHCSKGSVADERNEKTGCTPGH